jgi:hypothetical protein
MQNSRFARCWQGILTISTCSFAFGRHGRWMFCSLNLLPSQDLLLQQQLPQKRSIGKGYKSDCKFCALTWLLLLRTKVKQKYRYRRPFCI